MGCVHICCHCYLKVTDFIPALSCINFQIDSNLFDEIMCSLVMLCCFCSALCNIRNEG